MARAATKSKGATAGQLQLEIRQGRAQNIRNSDLLPDEAKADATLSAAPAAPPPSPEPMVRSVYADEEPSTPFCAWLLKQKGASGFVGGLATAAAGDRTFPREGDVEAARKWLQRLGASGDDWEALDDAESAWLAA